MPTADRGYLGDCDAVFNRVKAGFVWTSDDEQHGMEDWRIPEDFDRVRDDCDGFALACRELLREKGHEPRLVCCLTERGGGHLICALGKVALDNRMTGVETLERLVKFYRYELVSISGIRPGDDWHEVKGLVS